MTENIKIYDIYIEVEFDYTKEEFATRDSPPISEDVEITQVWSDSGADITDVVDLKIIEEKLMKLIRNGDL